MSNADPEEGMGKGNSRLVNCAGEEELMQLETIPEHASAQLQQDQSPGRTEQGLGKGMQEMEFRPCSWTYPKGMPMPRLRRRKGPIGEGLLCRRNFPSSRLMAGIEPCTADSARTGLSSLFPPPICGEGAGSSDNSRCSPIGHYTARLTSHPAGCHFHQNPDSGKPQFLHC